MAMSFSTSPNGRSFPTPASRTHVSGSLEEELRARASEERGGVVLLSKNDQPLGVFLSVEEYELILATANLAINPAKLIALLKKSEKVKSAEDYQTYSIEEVFR